jgi:hypothetical protein
MYQALDEPVSVTEASEEQQFTTREGNARAVAEIAEKEMAALVRQQGLIVARIQEIKRTLTGLGVLFGDNILSESTRRLLNHGSPTAKRGLTSACRQVILHAKQPLRAAEICGRLTHLAPGILDNHKSPMASVATIMNRLCAYGEARSVLMPTGQKAWESTGVVPGSESGSDSPKNE